MNAGQEARIHSNGPGSRQEGPAGERRARLRGLPSPRLPPPALAAASGDAATGLMSQRIVPSMVAGGYNTFRVTAIGGVISIAINGVDVFAVVDNTYSVGRVGVGMYSFGSGELFVDSVKLKKIPASLLNRTAQRPGVIYSTGTPVENPKIKLVP